MKDFIKVETKKTFVTEKFKVRSSYYVNNEKWEHGTVCLLTSKCSSALDFIYVNKFGNIQDFTLRPDDFIDDDYTITEAIYKVDVPEVKIISEWKTIKEAFATPGYFNNGDCYEIMFSSQIGPFSRTVKGFLSEYYQTKAMLRFVVHSVDSETKAAVLDIVPPDTTDNVKIRRLN